MAQIRFRDDGRTIYEFLDSVLVLCPQCGARAVVKPVAEPDADEHAHGSNRPPMVRWSAPRRLTCGHCGLTRTNEKLTAGFGRAVDPYFALPLALQSPCAGHVVWAFNGDHLDHLLHFVEATIRERPAPMSANDARASSLIERMPTWFGAATNRPAIAAALRRLRASLD